MINEIYTLCRGVHKIIFLDFFGNAFSPVPVDRKLFYRIFFYPAESRWPRLIDILRRFIYSENFTRKPRTPRHGGGGGGNAVRRSSRLKNRLHESRAAGRGRRPGEGYSREGPRGRRRRGDVTKRLAGGPNCTQRLGPRDNKSQTSDVSIVMQDERI